MGKFSGTFLKDVLMEPLEYSQQERLQKRQLSLDLYQILVSIFQIYFPIFVEFQEVELIHQLVS